MALGALALLLGGGSRPSRRAPPVSWFEPALPTTMHPLYAATDTDLRAQALVYDRLFFESPAGGWTSRVVAESEVTAEGLRLRLVPGVRWHDGARLDAHDVCFTIDALREPSATSPVARRARQVLRRCVVDPDEPLAAEITVVNRPTAEPRALLEVPLLPAHLGDPADPDGPLATSPVGTGPMAASFDGRAWRFTAHDNPHHRPAIREMRLEAGIDPRLQVAALLNGGVGGLIDVPPAQLSEVRASDAARLHFHPRRRVWSMAVDTSDELLADPRVREALDRSLDRAALAEAVLGRDPEREEQVWTLASGPFPPSDPGCNRGVPVPDRDPERAAALLEEAGLVRVDGAWTHDGEPMRLRIGAPAGLVGADALLATVAEQLAGFEVEPVVLEPARFRDEALAGALAGELDLVVNAWDTRPHALTPVFQSRATHAGALNVFGHADPTVDRLLSEAASATAAERPHVQRALHAHLADTRPHLFLWHLDGWSAWRADLEHVSISPVHYFDDLDVWRLDDGGRRRR